MKFLLPLTVLAGAACIAQTSSAPVRPAYGQFGFDTAGMDRTVRPGDDFYRYANGLWEKATPIPADKANYGMFTKLEDLNRGRVRGILEDAQRDGESRIGRAYASYLDKAAIERRGLRPLEPWLDEIRAIRTRADYGRVAITAARNKVPLPVSLAVGPDDGAPDTITAIIAQDGLGMPDRDYYLADTAAMRTARSAYRTYLVRALTMLGEGDADRRADALVAHETAIARVSWTATASRDATRTYNRVRVTQLDRTMPGFGFAGFLKGVGADAQMVTVAQPDAVEGIARLTADAPIAVLRDTLLVRSLHAYAEFLPRAFVNADFAFYGKVLSGAETPEPRWARAVSFATAVAPDEVSRRYVARYFTPETKAAATAMVRNIIAAMDKRIDRLDWMTPETRARAHAKLAAFIPKIGYPDRWHDYAGLDMQPGDALGNAMRARRFHFAYDIARIGKPRDRWEWNATPMTVDAFANYPTIEIVFPAAILQPPFFDPAADPAINYGGIGASIGHEMSHQFDDQGSKYDERGRLAAWWTPADRTRFEALTARLARQYDAYQPLPGTHINGALTLGENIADLAGLTVAYDAYRLSLNGKPAPVIDGFTGDQRFFLGWAQIWRLRYREADLRRRLLTNSHAPAAQRVWTMRNLDPWYEAYRPSPDSALALPPDQRVRIW
jgi:putative endopeptidase